MLVFLGAQRGVPGPVGRAFDRQRTRGLRRRASSSASSRRTSSSRFAVSSGSSGAESGRRSFRRYVNAFVETSLPTLVILYYMTILGPVQALLMPTAYPSTSSSSCSRRCGSTSRSRRSPAWSPRRVRGRRALGSSAHDPDSRPGAPSLPQHLGKAFILLVGGIAAGFVARRCARASTRAARLEERARILGVFGQHVSPEVVDRLLAERRRAKSELRDVCVMFLDIRGFTRFSEKRAREVVDYLNAIFERMVDA